MAVIIRAPAVCSDQRLAWLSAGISLGGKSTELWFTVELSLSRYLISQRADAFVAALAFTAAFLEQDICCEAPVSESLLYQFNSYFLPSLASLLGKKPILVRARAACGALPSEGKTGVGYSGGADSLYSVLTHTRSECKQPLDALCVINAGCFEEGASRRRFYETCRQAEALGKELSLQTVSIDTNLHEVLSEHYLDVYPYRLMAAALALGGLFRVYLLSSGEPVEQFHFFRHNAAVMDLLNVHCFSAETTRFYPAGGGVRRGDKLAALAEWEPVWTRLHYCFTQSGRNCGHCKKCRRDTVTLWALGKLDRFQTVYDCALAERMRVQNIAFLIANRQNPLYAEVLELMERRGIPIPESARVLGAQFSAALRHLEEKGEPR